MTKRIGFYLTLGFLLISRDAVAQWRVPVAVEGAYWINGDTVQDRVAGRTHVVGALVVLREFEGLRAVGYLYQDGLRRGDKDVKANEMVTLDAPFVLFGDGSVAADILGPHSGGFLSAEEVLLLPHATDRSNTWWTKLRLSRRPLDAWDVANGPDGPYNVSISVGTGEGKGHLAVVETPFRDSSGNYMTIVRVDLPRLGVHQSLSATFHATRRKTGQIQLKTLLVDGRKTWGTGTVGLGSADIRLNQEAPEVSVNSAEAWMLAYRLVGTLIR
jgi:hypothetical protein